ncbi:hypothetical protein MSG28_010594, partial [Choristoneura fumiferana]
QSNKEPYCPSDKRHPPARAPPWEPGAPRFPLRDGTLRKYWSLDTFAYDPQRYAMDYHSIGFRECAAEVARYLVSCEGLDIQDPLRLRLMSHLQCFAAQRELAAKSANWGYPQYPATPVAQPQHGYTELRQEPTTSTASTTVSAPMAVAAPLSAPPSYPHYPPAPPPPAPPGPHPAPPVPHYPTPYPHHPTQHQYSQNSAKPYRPWGAELAY